MSEINMNTLSFFEENPDLQPLAEVIQVIMGLPDEGLTEETIKSLNGMIKGAITPKMREDSIQAMVDAFEDQEYTRKQAQESIKATKKEIDDLIKSLKPSTQKETLLYGLFETLYDVFDTAIEKYHNYSIALPMTLEDGAHMPTYAHEGDAAADLYAAEDMTLPAHSISNMIKTGVHIQLPEGWIAMIFPRSSIGAKTGLRLSNSVGIIDTGYLGQLGVLYDNISDSDYTIHAGDRIAQLMVMPSYRFKPQVVKELQDTTRGEGGFGSTGK